jgi:hypothetical protein
MKELYTAPEAELLCLAANERLASHVVEFEDLFDNENMGTGVVESATVDIDVSLDTIQ